MVSCEIPAKYNFIFIFKIKIFYFIFSPLVFIGHKFMGFAIDPTCINIGRLERTKLNLVHFKWGSRFHRNSLNLFSLTQ